MVNWGQVSFSQKWLQRTCPKLAKNGQSEPELTKLTKLTNERNEEDIGKAK